MSRLRHFIVNLQTVVLAVGIAISLPAQLAHANGNPVSIVLSYLNGVSNTGPTSATGVAELVPREGEARVTVAGLNKLSGEQYVVWIMNSATNERMAIGGFNTDDNGVGKLEQFTRDAWPDKGWDTVFVSIEAAGAIPAQSSNRRSIAGKWPVPGSQQGTQGAGAPSELPATGGVPVQSPTSTSAPWGAVVGGLLLAIAVSGLIGFRLARASQRGSA
jgi:hypothetical protein